MKKYLSIFALTLLISLAYHPNKVQAAACTTNTAGLGSVTGSFTVSTAGTYRVWSRMQASSSDANANSYTLEIDNSICNITVGDVNVPQNVWTWIDHRDGNSTSKVNVSLSAGTHTFTMYGREAGVKLDKVVFSGDPACTPNTFGSNCQVAAPVTVNSTMNLTIEPASGTFQTNTTNAFNIYANVTGAISGLSFTLGTGNMTIESYDKTGTSFDDNSVQAGGTPGSNTITILSGYKSGNTGTSKLLVGKLTLKSPGSAQSNNLTFSNPVAKDKDLKAIPSTAQNATYTINQSDTTPPTVTLTPTNIAGAIPANSIINSVQQVTFSTTATDAGGIKSFLATINGSATTITSNTITTPNSNGDYNVEVTATDNANLSTKTNKVVKVRHPDIDRDGVIGTRDMLYVLKYFNSVKQEADFNGADNVDTYDYLYVLKYWNQQ